MARYSAEFVTKTLLSGRAGARLLNENVVLLSVWIDFANDPARPIDLLLVLFDDTSSAKLAQFLQPRISQFQTEPLLLTPIEGAVAVKVDFDGFSRAVLPATGINLLERSAELLALVKAPVANATEIVTSDEVSLSQLIAFAERSRNELKPELRTVLLVLLISAARDISEDIVLDTDFYPPHGNKKSRRRHPPTVSCKGWPSGPRPNEPKIWRVAKNRTLSALAVSVETIKADAAMRVFDVDCSSITWAVIDSGIDGSHPAFRDHRAGGYAIRIDKAYDFTKLREWASYGSLSDPAKTAQAIDEISAKLLTSAKAAEELLKKLHQDMINGRPYDWDTLSRLLETSTDRLWSFGEGKVEGHGTHVAGVLAGDWQENGKPVFNGVCPALRLYDLRVLGSTNDDTEFAVIAALAFVRWLNSRNRFMVIHGVNLSLGLDHDKSHFACGRTPVCLAADATVSSGVVVVAAAGNYGSQAYETVEGTYSGYAAISICDPRNTESVITVGSTHRERPHDYGVSFFSSRGPTGDGRAKPDLVAPGERIDGPFPNLGFGKLDGTSMSAPHVSGVAAMLLARHQELIGNPARVKSILTRSATDLGRERNFQGAGLVDALRAHHFCFRTLFFPRFVSPEFRFDESGTFLRAT